MTHAVLFYPGAPLEPPSDVSVTIDSGLGNRVLWTDNSDDETGFELQLLRGGDVLSRSGFPADTTSGSFWNPNMQLGAEYAVRVLAFSTSNQSASETVTFRWDHPEAPDPVADLAATTAGIRRVGGVMATRRGGTSRAWRPAGATFSMCPRSARFPRRPI